MKNTIAEAKHLSRAGVAKQRKAIVIGIKTSIVDFTDAKDTLYLLLVTHYFDCITDVGASKNCKTAFILARKSHADHNRT
jgi:uncharacterized protein YgiB involved in biofilm formation